MVNERKYPELAQLADEVSRCGRCGFCQSVCPVYRATGHEEGVARGRNMFARGLLSGDLEIARENEAFFTECLLCRACVEMCFSSVKTDDIVLAMRRDNARARGKDAVRQYIFRYLLFDHRRLGRAIRYASFGKTAGAVRLAQALDIFGWCGSRFKRLDQELAEIPRRSLRERLAQRARPERAHKEAFFFVGCGINFMFPEVGEATVAVLEKLGYAVIIADNGCCGLPAHAHGASDAAVKLAERNISLLSQPEALIITDCSSCASFLKSYSTLISNGGGNRALIREAERFSSRVRDVSEVLREAVPLLASKWSKAANPQRVTFHDPCHLSRRQGQGEQRLTLRARELLRSVPGIEYVEMKEADMCCGGAGAFAFEHPDLSLRILERKMRNIAASSADIVATTCPSCMMQLRSALLQESPAAGRKIQVKHLVELVR